MTKLAPLVLVALFSLSFGYCDGCKKPLAFSGESAAAAGSAQPGR